MTAGFLFWNAAAANSRFEAAPRQSRGLCRQLRAAERPHPLAAGMVQAATLKEGRG